MTTSHDSTPFARKTIIYSPFDRTARPQLVKKEINKNYFLLINEFKKLSGVGCLLNTSFNIHGEPIVNSKRFDVFLRTNLKYLLIDNILISK